MNYSMKHLAGVFLISILVFANEDGIEVRPHDKERIETEKQKIVTTFFVVSNKSAVVQEFIAEVQLPKTWKCITEDFPFELDVNQTDIKIVSFYIPATVKAGEYKVTYRMRGRKYPSFSDSYTITVVVVEISEQSTQLQNEKIDR
jgi:hypothetical protein